MAKDILCTLGPASLDERVIGRLEGLGVSLFRLNLSHTRLADLAPTIAFIRSRSRVPICLDTEGAQIRTGGLREGTVEVRENTVILAARRPLSGDGATFNLYPPDIIDKLAVGDFISIDFNAVLAQVVELGDDGARMRVLTGGAIASNKAVTVDRDIALAPLTAKDRAALAVGVAAGIRHFALSFANRGSDVEELRALVGDGAFVISKIECLNGLKHLDDIAARSDALLIDRGDLSRELPIERIPQVQKEIIRRGRQAGVKTYVATNLLESMVSSPVPTRAEVNDVYNTLIDGADGLVLAAETAIGAFPVRCASMIVRLVREFENPPAPAALRYHADPISLLVPPHGGRLVHREAAAEDVADLDRLPVLAVGEAEVIDGEQIAVGTYSPLAGFMDRETLESVLHAQRLPDGTPWTMPVVLQTAADSVRFASGERVALAAPSGRIHAVLDVSDVFPVEFARVARAWFGTAAADHPGVARLAAGGGVFVGGTVTLIARLDRLHRHYDLTPEQTRFIFTHKGWGKVVGFHGTGPVDRFAEFVQLRAIERSGADGLYINPAVGGADEDGFLAAAVLKSYELLLAEGGYPAGRVVLGGFSAKARRCGPRESIFLALCRKNMGCSHFVVGPDPSGYADLYPPSATVRLFESLGDIGITPLFFDALGYDPASGSYACGAGASALAPLAAAEVRARLMAGGSLPEWHMRGIVQDMLRAEIAAGRAVFGQGGDPGP